MHRVGQIVYGIGLLGLLGYIIYKNVSDTQYAYGMMVLIVAFFAVVLQIYRCGNKQKIDKKISQSILFVLIIISILANIFIYAKTSPTPLKNSSNDWSKQTIYEYYLPKESREINIESWDLFSNNILNDLLDNKTVFVQDILKDDIRVQATANLGVVKQFAGIGKDGIQKYLENYKPQEIVFTTKEGNQQKLYIVTDAIWLDDSTDIYIILDAENNVWMIPDKLLDSHYIIEESFNYSYENLYINDKLENVTYNYQFDEVIEYLFNKGKKNPLYNVMYLFLLWGIGFLFLLPFSNKIADEFIVYLSIPTGTLLEIVSCIIIGCILDIQINKFSLLTSMFIPVCLIWGLWIWKGKKILKIDISFNVSVAIGLMLFAIIYFSVWHKVHLSTDSIHNIVLAQNIVQEGSFRKYFANVSNYSLFMPVVNIGATIFNVKIFNAFIPVLTCSCLSIVWLVMNKHLSEMKNFQKYIIIMGCFAAIITVPTFELNVVWILNNLSTGLYYVLAFVLFLEGKRTHNNYYKYLALPLFISASVFRIEAPICGAIFLLIWNKMDEEISKKCSVGLGLATTIVFFLNFLYNREGVIFWSVSKGFVVLLLSWITFFYLHFIQKYKKWQLITKKIDLGVLIEIGMLFGILVVSIFFKREMALINLNALTSNLLTTGVYGLIWIIYLFTFIFDFTKEQESTQVLRALRRIINVNFLIIFALMLFRVLPLRISVSDSGCRMMLHVLPLVIIYFVYIFKNLFANERAYDEGEKL